MRVKKTAVVVFIAGAVLLLFGGVGAFYLWKVSEKEVSVSDQTVRLSKLVWLKISATVQQLPTKISLLRERASIKFRFQNLNSLKQNNVHY